MTDYGLFFFVMGLLATAIGWNRRLLEEVLLRVKEGQLAAAPAPVQESATAGRGLAAILPLRGARGERTKVA